MASEVAGGKGKRTGEEVPLLPLEGDGLLSCEDTLPECKAEPDARGRGNPQICIPQFASFLRLRLHQFLRSSGPAFERVRSDHHLSLEVHLLLSTFCCSLLSSLLPRKAYPTPPGGCQFPFSHATGPPHTVPSRFPCVRGACGSFCSGGPVCSSAFALRSDDSFASRRLVAPRSSI